MSKKVKIQIVHQCECECEHQAKIKILEEEIDELRDEITRLNKIIE